MQHTYAEQLLRRGIKSLDLDPVLKNNLLSLDSGEMKNYLDCYFFLKNERGFGDFYIVPILNDIECSRYYCDGIDARLTLAELKAMFENSNEPDGNQRLD